MKINSETSISIKCLDLTPLENRVKRSGSKSISKQPIKKLEKEY